MKDSWLEAIPKQLKTEHTDGFLCKKNYTAGAIEDFAI